MVTWINHESNVSAWLFGVGVIRGAGSSLANSKNSSPTNRALFTVSQTDPPIERVVWTE